MRDVYIRAKQIGLRDAKQQRVTGIDQRSDIHVAQRHHARERRIHFQIALHLAQAPHGGLRGIKLEEGDALLGCVLTTGQNEIVLVSYKGQAVRFNEDDLRDQGRDTVGVTGMRFKIGGDHVKAIEVCDPEDRLLIAREDGIGKRTPFEDYRLISRGGTGVIAIDLPEDGSVNVAGALSVRDGGEVMLLTAKGQSIRTRVSEIRETGRGAKGVKLLTLADGDKLLSIARIVETEEQTAVPFET